MYSSSNKALGMSHGGERLDRPLHMSILVP